jgi:NADH-quinone oxidoreductase subunit J
VLTQALFYVLSAITLIGAVGAVSSRAAIYCAIWFAGSLLGVAGLLVLAGAQFLGIATIVVYAGAIVVTFLCGIMLAQPRGNESYDRVSWGSLSKPVAVFAAAALVAASIFSQDTALKRSLREDVAAALAVIPASADYPKIESADVVAASYTTVGDLSALEVVLRPTVFQKTENPDAQKAALTKAFTLVADDRALHGFDSAKTQINWIQSLPVNDTLREHHVEALGVNLFGNQLVAVQVAGVLLLVALVGAISILTQDAPAPRQPEAAA